MKERWKIVSLATSRDVADRNYGAHMSRANASCIGVLWSLCGWTWLIEQSKSESPSVSSKCADEGTVETGQLVNLSTWLIEDCGQQSTAAADVFADGTCSPGARQDEALSAASLRR